MGVRTRIQFIGHDFKIAVNEALSPEAQSQAAADFARGAFDEANETNRRILGRVPPSTTTVDGRKGAPLESVRPNGGVIVFEWELIGDVLLWIAKTLVERSPSLSGRYRSSHTLFADGTETAVGGNIPQAEEYVFLNPLPYSRKIDIGKTEKGRPFLISVENRIYERTAKDAQARFGNMAKITYGFRAPLAGKFVQISRVGPLQVKRNTRGQFLKGSHTRAGNAQERDLRVPAIIIRAS